MSVPVKEAAADFLAQKRIAIAGVSRKGGGEHGGNVVYERLKQRGFDVFAVNPHADEIDGDPCFADIASIPDGVDAVVIATWPEIAPSVMQQCIDAGVRRVWMHRSFGSGSVSDEATALGRSNGIAVIDGGCPLMFPPTDDTGHRIMRVMLNLGGKIPKQV